jgi:hypothetical protein
MPGAFRKWRIETPRGRERSRALLECREEERRESAREERFLNEWNHHGESVDDQRSQRDRRRSE